MSRFTCVWETLSRVTSTSGRDYPLLHMHACCENGMHPCNVSFNMPPVAPSTNRLFCECRYFTSLHTDRFPYLAWHTIFTFIAVAGSLQGIWKDQRMSLVVCFWNVSAIETRPENNNAVNGTSRPSLMQTVAIFAGGHIRRTLIGRGRRTQPAELYLTYSHNSLTTQYFAFSERVGDESGGRV